MDMGYSFVILCTANIRAKATVLNMNEEIAQKMINRIIKGF